MEWFWINVEKGEKISEKHRQAVKGEALSAPGWKRQYIKFKTETYNFCGWKQP